MSIFATIKWDTKDIASIRPDWYVAKVEDAASYARKPLEESCVEQGWESLEVLLDIFEQDRKDKEDIETLGCDDSRVATKYVYGRIRDALNSKDLDEMSQELSNFFSELAHNYKVDTGKLIGADDE